jgi:hypothetical protein
MIPLLIGIFDAYSSVQVCHTTALVMADESRTTVEEGLWIKRSGLNISQARGYVQMMPAVEPGRSHRTALISRMQYLLSSNEHNIMELYTPLNKKKKNSQQTSESQFSDLSPSDQ